AVASQRSRLSARHLGVRTSTRQRGWGGRVVSDEPVPAAPPAAPAQSGRTAIAPIFVVGAGRSGTTLLRLMLNEHPDVAIPSESHFIAPLIAALGATTMLSGDNLEQALSMVIESPEWQRDFGHTPEELRADIGDGPLRLDEFVDRVFRLEVGPEPAHW